MSENKKTAEIPEFKGFPKMARLSRDIVITEKIDGTNAQILITDDGEVFAGSRNRWITPESDNFGFAKWVESNRDELLKLGTGQHFGEWWGSGIQRGYGMEKGEKKFSLFNSIRWCEFGGIPQVIPLLDPRVFKMQETAPECCSVVPTLYRGVFSIDEVDNCIDKLRDFGSVAKEGFMRPEGVIVFHVAGNVKFKKTLEKDDQPKGQFKNKI